MASSRRSAKTSLAQRLQTEPYRFSFVQAVRLLEQIGRQCSPPRQRVGYDALPAQECVHFGALAARSFPATEVVSLTNLESGLPAPATPAESPQETDAPDADGSAPASDSAALLKQVRQTVRELDDYLPPKMTVAFMGLFGPSGVLPHHDTQRIIDVGTKKNPERDFLDVFNHRIISLFYRASIKYRIPFAYERNYRQQRLADEDDVDDGETKDSVTRSLYSLAGMGTRGLRGRLELLDELAIEFAGLFGHQPKNAVSLQRMLESYFELPLRVEQFVGQWRNLSSENISEMPSRSLPRGQNCSLGRSFILGERVWDITAKYRIRLGPLKLSTFEAYLPGTRNLVEVAQFAQLYGGNQFDFDVQLELLAEEVPAIQLNGHSRLGFNTWLFSQQPTENKADAVFVQSGLPLRGPLADAA